MVTQHPKTGSAKRNSSAKLWSSRTGRRTRRTQHPTGWTGPSRGNRRVKRSQWLLAAGEVTKSWDELTDGFRKEDVVTEFSDVGVEAVEELSTPVTIGVKPIFPSRIRPRRARQAVAQGVAAGRAASKKSPRSAIISPTTSSTTRSSSCAPRPTRSGAYHNVCPHRGRRLVDTPAGRAATPAASKKTVRLRLPRLALRSRRREHHIVPEG